MLKIGDKIFCLTSLLLLNDADPPAGELVGISEDGGFKYGTIKSSDALKPRGPYNLSMCFLDTLENRRRLLAFQDRSRLRSKEADKDMHETLRAMREAEEA